VSQRNENIANEIWQDEPFALLSAPAKLVYLWSFTNPLCGMAGLYKVRQQQIELDTGQTRGVVVAALDELAEHGMVAYLDGMLWVVARVKRLVSQTPQIAKSIAKDVGRAPATHPLRAAFLGWNWETRWPGGQLRETFQEARPTLTRGSREGHEIVEFIGECVNLTRGSADPPVVVVVADAVASEVPTSAVARDAVEEIWEHYLDAFYADRRGSVPDLRTHRHHIVAALRVRDAETCKLAITGLARSSWHGGDNGDGRRWTEIRYALHGNRQNKETDAERIDRMAARAAEPNGPIRPARPLSEREQKNADRIARGRAALAGGLLGATETDALEGSLTDAAA